MIFVTVGTGNTYGFERLIRKMDEIAREIDEEIIAQIGCTSYIPTNITYYRFIEKNDSENLFRNSRVIVCHSGIGSILTAIKFNKPVIIVPRRKKYNEHFDDHQIEIASELEKNSQLKVVHNVEDLLNALNDSHSRTNLKSKSNNRLVVMLRDYFNELDTKH